MVANVVELGARAAIQRQAQKWCIRLDGDEPLTDAETKALREWMSCSASHRDELVRLSRFWSQANILTELISGVEARRRERKRRHGRSWMRRAAHTTAGAVVGSVILAYSWLGSIGGTVTHAYRTAIGEQETIALSDGSSIQLNTNSQVRVMYSGRARRARLLRGEAFFSVAPNPNRVFEVYAADSTVRAMGTAFAVHLEGRRVDVTVVEGLVDISDGAMVDDVGAVGRGSVKAAAGTGELGRLRAGEVTRFDSGSGRMEVHQLAQPDLQRRMAWQEGYLAFAGEPLSEVVAQLNRYSTTTVVIGEPTLASMAIGGYFQIGDLHTVLDLLGRTAGIRARQVDERTIRLEVEPQH